MKMHGSRLAQALESFILGKAHTRKTVNRRNASFIAMIQPFDFNSQWCFLQHTDSQPV